MMTISTSPHVLLRQGMIQWLRTGFLFVGALAMLSACKDDTTNGSGNTPTAAPGTVLYVETNVGGPNQNAILAYRQKNDGSLEPLPGSPFATDGAGYANPTQKLGPDDTDQPLLLSADKKRLFAVNQGSNTIAVFDIQADGSLKAVAGSPFASGGVNPGGLGLANNRLYVVNKNDDGAPTGGKPNYTAFTVGANGQLTAIPGSTIETTSGASPAHPLVTPNQRFLFVDDFLAFMAPGAPGTLRGFNIGGEGKLTPIPGTPQAIPQTPGSMMAGGALGLWAHPTQNVLYVGFPMQDKVGVYSYDGSTGALTYRTAVNAGAAACWLRVNKAGTRLYCLNSGESTVSVYDLANPVAPAELQKFALKKPGPLFTLPTGMMFTSSEPFHEEFSPDEKYLFVVSQHANPSFTENHNYLHVLAIGADGKLSEPTEPVQPPVPATARPQGVVSVAL